MRRRSNKRNELIAAVSEDRDRFLEQMKEQCCICGDTWMKADYYPRTLDVHEIIGGGMRGVTYADRRAWLAVCREHHEVLQDRGRSPYVMQFALKLRSDPEYFDLAWLHRVGRWSDGFITMNDLSDVDTSLTR